LAMNLLMIQAAWAEPYRHQATGLVFPERIATLVKESEVTNFEAKSPGLGVGVAYDGPGITVTVYLYTAGLKAVPHDLESPVLKEYFQEALRDVARAKEMGYYSQVEKLSEDTAAWSDAGAETKSLHASFRVRRGNRDRLSHLYLLGFQNHFFKARFTCDQKIQETAERTQKEFLAELARILAGVGKETLDQGVPAVQ